MFISSKLVAALESIMSVMDRELDEVGIFLDDILVFLSRFLLLWHDLLLVF